MQCNQPISFLDKPPFFVSGPPHCQQFFVQQPPLQQRNYAPLFPSYPNPDIVGEGEVTSVIQPDGTIQLFFRPTNRWAQWNSHTGTYFVTSVNYPPSPLNIPVTYPQDNACFLPLPSPAAQFKFHNDQCTSTADIEYFFPRLRSTDITITPTSCAGVQVNSPACKNVVFTGKISRCDADKGCCSSHSDMSIDSDNLSTMSSAKTCCGSCKCSRKTSDSSACSKKTSLKLSSSTSITSLDEEAKKCLLKLKERKKKEIEKQQKLEEKKRDKEFKQRQKELEKHRQRCKKLKQKEQERQKQLEKLKKEYERKLAEAGSSQKCSKQCKNSLDSCDSSELLDSSDTHAKSCSTCCSSASVEEPECVKTLLSKPCEQMKERPCIIERSPMPPSRQQSRRASGTQTSSGCPPQKTTKKCCNVENCPKLK